MSADESDLERMGQQKFEGFPEERRAYQPKLGNVDFHVEIYFTLTPDEIWPDGVPEDATLDDVKDIMLEENQSFREWANDWEIVLENSPTEIHSFGFGTRKIEWKR